MFLFDMKTNSFEDFYQLISIINEVFYSKEKEKKDNWNKSANEMHHASDAFRRSIIFLTLDKNDKKN